MYGPPQAERVAAPPEGTAASCTISGCARTQQHSVVHGLRTHCVAAKCATAVFCRSMALWPLARAAAATQCARRSRQLQPPAASSAASVGCGARTAQRVLPCRQRAVAAAVAYSAAICYPCGCLTPGEALGPPQARARPGAGDTRLQSAVQPHAPRRARPPHVRAGLHYGASMGAAVSQAFLSGLRGAAAAISQRQVERG